MAISKMDLLSSQVVAYAIRVLEAVQDRDIVTTDH